MNFSTTFKSIEMHLYTMNCFMFKHKAHKMYIKSKKTYLLKRLIRFDHQNKIKLDKNIDYYFYFFCEIMRHANFGTYLNHLHALY